MNNVDKDHMLNNPYAQFVLKLFNDFRRKVRRLDMNVQRASDRMSHHK